MQFQSDDKIERTGNGAYHQSAGGFVFYEEPASHRLYVALIRPESETRFFIPKGHIKAVGETPEQAAVREVREELSLKAQPDVIAGIGVDKYSFTLDDSGTVHYKEVFLFVFNLKDKAAIKPLRAENIVEAAWLEFYEAAGKIAYDKENLLKARQFYYANKHVTTFRDYKDVKSLVVAIPTHNGGETIARTLDSVASALQAVPTQIKRDVLICLDHCSDGTDRAIKEFIDQKRGGAADIKVIENDGPRGKTTAMDKMVAGMNADIICFVDDDTELNLPCLKLLLDGVISNPSLRCAYPNLIRCNRRSLGLWRKFWSYVLGIKFEIQPYDKRSELMGGACIMMRHENFVYMRDGLINDDQFLQYMYWPHTAAVSGAIASFSAVETVSQYSSRYTRISLGIKQLAEEFPKDRIDKCNKALFRPIDYAKIKGLPFKQRAAFRLYRFVRFFVKASASFKLRHMKHLGYGWERTVPSG